MAYNFTTKKLLKAIEGSNGVMSTIAKKLGCNWMTARSAIQANEEAVAALEEENENLLDKAEKVVHDEIALGNLTAAKYVLSTKGKGRGYTYARETKHSGSIVLDDYDWSSMSIEERKEILSKIKKD